MTTRELIALAGAESLEDLRKRMAEARKWERLRVERNEEWKRWRADPFPFVQSVHAEEIEDE